MSGLGTLRDAMLKPVMVVTTAAAVLAAGMTVLWWASNQPQQNAHSALQPACIALAIDRDSGTTTTQPCEGTPMLVAGSRADAK